jgi:lipoic acid synthetase
VIKYAKGSGKVLTKSGVMLGLGETEGEVISVMKDLRWAGCDLLSIGQYLSPSRKHYPVKEFIAPEMFNSYRTRAIEMGFRYVESGPYVRSSYMASNYI